MKPQDEHEIGAIRAYFEAVAFNVNVPELVKYPSVIVKTSVNVIFPLLVVFTLISRFAKVPVPAIV